MEKYVPLVEVTRGKIVESVHYGALAVVNTCNHLVASRGNPDSVTFLRSAAKPIQVLPFVEMGGMERFSLTDRELAIMCASHSGTDGHVRVVEEIQSKLGVSESDLLCGVHMPLHKPTAQALMERHEEPTPNRNNCSGKHTGMLAQTLLLKATKEDYINPEHPVQKAILQAISEMCDMQPEEVEIGIDGCSAPVFAVPLRKAALAYSRLGDPSGLSQRRATAIRRIVKAMITYPEMVAGPDRFDTLLMQAGRGKIMAKMGAEGFQGLSILPNARGKNSKALGICIKIADGDISGRAAPLVSLEILRKFSALSKDMLALDHNFSSRTFHNFADFEVGEIRSAITIDEKEI